MSARKTIKARRSKEPVKNYRRVKDTLPDKASALIRVAVKDLESAKKAGYIIDMGDFHAPLPKDDYRLKKKNQKEKACLVCFGGSVLACSLNIAHEVYINTYDLPNSVSNKVSALDEFRQGMIQEGLSSMGIDLDREQTVKGITVRTRLDIDDVSVPGYGETPEEHRAFIKSMRLMADALEKFGL